MFFQSDINKLIAIFQDVVTVLINLVRALLDVFEIVELIIWRRDESTTAEQSVRKAAKCLSIVQIGTSLLNTVIFLLFVV